MAPVQTRRLRQSTAPVLAWGLLSLLAPTAASIVIDGDVDEANNEAPEDDPGWSHVVLRGEWSAIYIGNGWVLTARHVGAGDVVIDGSVYSAETGSSKVVTNPNRTATDLLMFRIQSEPHLERLRIRRTSPDTGSEVVMIGAGRHRGAPVQWQGLAGYRWASDLRMRWGTNTIESVNPDLTIRNTRTFTTRFSYAATPHEATAAIGDSGGAVFVRDDARWELAGVMLAIDSYRDQPRNMSLYGNKTFSADLSAYRQAIEEIAGLATEESAALRR